MPTASVSMKPIATGLYDNCGGQWSVVSGQKKTRSTKQHEMARTKSDFVMLRVTSWIASCDSWRSYDFVDRCRLTVC